MKKLLILSLCLLSTPVLAQEHEPDSVGNPPVKGVQFTRSGTTSSMSAQGTGQNLAINSSSGTMTMSSLGTLTALAQQFIFKASGIQSLAIGSNGQMAFQPAAVGNQVPVVFNSTGQSNMTAGVEYPAMNFGGSPSTRQGLTGALALEREFVFTGNNKSFVGASTVTDLGTIGYTLDGCSTNATCTNVSGILHQTTALTGTPTNSYGLNIAADTGATNNYAAVFQTGNVGIGSASPQQALHIQVNGVATNGYVEEHDSYSGASGTAPTPAGTKFLAARNTVASPATLVSGDIIYNLDAWAHDGTSFTKWAGVNVVADGVPSVSSHPTRWDFYTTPAGSITPVVTGRFGSNGGLTVGGTTASPINGLLVSSDSIVTGYAASNSADGVKTSYTTGAGYISSGASDSLNFGNGTSTNGVPASVWLTLGSAGGLQLFSTIPTASAGTVATGSTSNKGQITGLSSATTTTITFAANAPISSSAPSCTFSGSAALVSPLISSISSTAVTVTMTAFTGTLYYVCF